MKNCKGHFTGTILCMVILLLAISILQFQFTTKDIRKAILLSSSSSFLLPNEGNASLSKHSSSSSSTTTTPTPSDISCFLNGTRSSTGGTTTNGGASSWFPPFPDFIIAGTQKGGTSALQKLLTQHPHILNVINIHHPVPEPHFFDYYDFNTTILFSNTSTTTTNTKEEYICHLRKEYSKYFNISQLLWNQQQPNHSKYITFEKTPSYMLHPPIPRLIHTIAPQTKILLILRNPTQRWFSSYEMEYMVWNHFANISTEEHLVHELETLQQAHIIRNDDDDDEMVLPSLRLLDRSSNHNHNHNNNNNNNNNAATTNAKRQTTTYRLLRNKEYIDHVQRQRQRADATVLRTFLHRGMYLYQVLDFIEYFPLYSRKKNPKGTLMIILLEHFQRHPQDSLQTIQEFIFGTSSDDNNNNYYTMDQLQNDYGPTVEKKQTKWYQEKYKTYQTEILSPAQNTTQKYLQEFYKPYNDLFFQLLKDKGVLTDDDEEDLSTLWD